MKVKTIIFALTICLVIAAIALAGCKKSEYACADGIKTCPDGSKVGRTAPSCQFAQCPNDTGIADVFGNSPDIEPPKAPE